MVAPKNTHLPEVAGGIATVTGTLIVDTGLRKLQTAVATLGADSTATDAIVTMALEPLVAGGTQKINVKVWAVDGVTPGVTATPVHWLAVGE